MSIPTPRQFKFTAIGVGLLTGPLVWASWILRVYSAALTEPWKTLVVVSVVGILHGAAIGFAVGRLRLGKLAGGIAGLAVPLGLVFTIYFVGFGYNLFASGSNPNRNASNYHAVVFWSLLYLLAIMLNIFVPCVAVGLLTSALTPFVALKIRWGNSRTYAS